MTDDTELFEAADKKFKATMGLLTKFYAEIARLKDLSKTRVLDESHLQDLPQLYSDLILNVKELRFNPGLLSIHEHKTLIKINVDSELTYLETNKIYALTKIFLLSCGVNENNSKNKVNEIIEMTKAKLKTYPDGSLEDRGLVMRDVSNGIIIINRIIGSYPHLFKDDKYINLEGNINTLYGETIEIAEELDNKRRIEEAKRIEELRIAEDKRIEELRVAEDKRIEELRVAEDKRIEELSEKPIYLEQKDLNVVKMILTELTELLDRCTTEKISEKYLRERAIDTMEVLYAIIPNLSSTPTFPIRLVNMYTFVNKLDPNRVDKARSRDVSTLQNFIIKLKEKLTLKPESSSRPKP